MEEDKMKSLVTVATCLMAGFLLGQVYSQQRQAPALPPHKPEVPEGYIPYKFRCWLCDGDNKFACKPQSSERSFPLDCCRCGMENSVKVEPPQHV
jgi:hypothetical protein